ncbi:MAG: hypothetical protein FJ215_13025 [Ignavibacteria bacterium]|nr:hypothetical protein [Ignavibacteria bacterium]
MRQTLFGRLVPISSLILVAGTTALAQTVTISANGYLKMLVVDPIGRKIGYEPSSGKYYSDIPGVSIGAASIGLVSEEGPEDDPYEKDPIDVVFESIPGRHAITLYGTKLTSYDVNVIARHKGGGPTTNVASGGFIDSGMVFNFFFLYDPSSRAETALSKNVTVQDLRQQISAVHRLNLLGDKKLFDDWNKELDKIERDLSRKDSAKARQELDKFGKEVDKLRKETIKHEEKKVPKPSKFITQDAYQVIREDIDILLNQLPKK